MFAAMKGSGGTIRALLSHPNMDTSGKDNVGHFDLLLLQIAL